MAEDVQPAPPYRVNEGELTLHEAPRWRDHTLTVLRLEGEGQAAASLVLTREALPFGMGVAEYTRAELARLKATLLDFVQVGSAPVAWADGAGEAALTRWRSSEGLIDQITACREVGKGALLIFTATHPAPMPGHAYEALLATIQSFQPRT